MKQSESNLVQISPAPIRRIELETLSSKVLLVVFQWSMWIGPRGRSILGNFPTRTQLYPWTCFTRPQIHWGLYLAWDLWLNGARMLTPSTISYRIWSKKLSCIRLSTQCTFWTNSPICQTWRFSDVADVMKHSSRTITTCLRRRLWNLNSVCTGLSLVGLRTSYLSILLLWGSSPLESPMEEYQSHVPQIWFRSPLIITSSAWIPLYTCSLSMHP